MSGTDSQLEVEIRQQPERLERFLTDGYSGIRDIARALRVREIDYVIVAARGTSRNAACYAQYLFGERMGLPVAFAAPSLVTRYGASAVSRNRTALVIGVSQSGRSPDIVSVLEAARNAGSPTIAVTNDADSPLASSAEFLIDLGVGVEHSVAATKTYTCSLAALAALVVELSADAAGRAALRGVPPLMRGTLDDAFAAVEALDQTVSAHHVVAVGRGYNYATAMEIALKVRELSATVAEGFSSAELMHGPIAAITPDTLAIVVAARGKTRGSVLEAADALRVRGARLVVIAEDSHADLPLPHELPEWLSPLVAVVPGQVLALRRAVVGGNSIDRPLGLSKVTKTY